MEVFELCSGLAEDKDIKHNPHDTDGSAGSFHSNGSNSR